MGTRQLRIRFPTNTTQQAQKQIILRHVQADSSLVTYFFPLKIN